MKKTDPNSGDDPPIREKAEKILQNRRTEANNPICKADMKRLIHELQVHQIELEIQNEELIKTRQELEESLFHYIELYDFSPVGYLTLDTNGIIKNINLTGARILGQERLRLMNIPLVRFISDYSYQKFHLFFSCMQQETRGESGAIYLAREDNAPCVVHMKATADSSNKEFRLALIDITEKEEAEKKLRESEEKYRMIIENMQDIFFRIDNQETIIDMNPAGLKISGYSFQDEIINKVKAVSFFAHEDDYRKLCRLVEEKKVVDHYPVTLKRIDNTIVYAIVNAHQFYDQTGTSLGVEGIIHDITDLKNAEEGLRDANTKLRLLTGLTRHDVINELNMIQILLDFALDSKEPETIHDYLNQAIGASKQIEATIGFTREYENFGFAQSGWQKVYAIIESARKEISPGKITIQNHISPSLEVYADPIIRKVFSTLLDNAIRHGKKVSQITFSLLKEKQGLKIICEDDGTGIAEKEKELIFTYGFGVNTGIGLFLAKEMLSITGLSIQETGIEGKGARFEILVPEGKWKD